MTGTREAEKFESSFQTFDWMPAEAGMECKYGMRAKARVGYGNGGKKG